MTWITVDPGLGGTGYAVFNSEGPGAVPPADFGVLHARRGDWRARAHSLRRAFWAECQVHVPIQRIVIEFPELFASSAKSTASASKGNLFQLTYLVGLLGAVAADYTGEPPELITPRQWKGQLPKEVVIRRMLRAYGHEYSSHAADAVGIGLHLQGGL